MLHEKHDLLHELPEHRDTIHHLKVTSTRFSRLFNEYHEVNGEVRRIEMEIEVSSDIYLEDKKKQRLKLKDQLFQMILTAK